MEGGQVSKNAAVDREGRAGRGGGGGCSIWGALHNRRSGEEGLLMEALHLYVVWATCFFMVWYRCHEVVVVF